MQTFHAMVARPDRYAEISDTYLYTNDIDHPT